MANERVHKKACHSCGGDMTDGQVRRQALAEKLENRNMDEIDSTYAHLRAVIENCKTATPEAIRHQLVALMPETRTFAPDEAEKLRASGHGDLVELQEQRARQGWGDYGYPPDGPSGGGR